MTKKSLFALFLCILCAVRIGAGEAPSDTAKGDAATKKAEAAKTTKNGTATAKSKEAQTAKPKTAKATELNDAKTAKPQTAKAAEPKDAKKAEEKKPAVTTKTVALSADNSLVHEPASDTSGYIVIRSDGEISQDPPPVMTEEEYAAYIAQNGQAGEVVEVVDELVAEYIEEDDSFIFPNGMVVSNVLGSTSDAEFISSSSSSWPCSWRDFSVSKDYSNGKGLVVYADAGYKWVFLRKMGFNAGGVDMRRNLTISGAAAALGFGYSFGDDIPIALEVDIGVGPSLVFHNRKTLGARTVEARQKMSIYSLDASIDYDIKTCSKFTPFIGINTGFALVGDRGRVKIYDGASLYAAGDYDRKHRVNLMGGLRLGTKLQVHDRVILSAVAEYNYLGDIPAQQFTLSDGSQASTKRIKAHEFNVKLGAKLNF